MCIPRQKLTPRSSVDLFDIFGLSQKRKLTDVPFLIAFATCVVILMIVMMWTLCSSDTSRLAYGYVFKEFIDNLGIVAKVCCIGLGVSVTAIYWFRHFVDVFVWTMLVGVVLLTAVGVGYIWKGDENRFLITRILVTFAPLILTLCILVSRDRIKLIIRFYEDTIKTVFDMPLLLLLPLLTISCIILVVASCLFTFGLMYCDGNYNVGIIFAMVFVWIMMFWMVQFVLACHQIVISGVVARYYFTRDKCELVSPIYSSFYILIRYHLGTVAFGSLIITPISVLKILYRARTINCSLYEDNFLKYVTSIGYIITATHGKPLCQSGIRAVNLFICNLLTFVGMSWVGTFVFFTVKVLVVAVTTLIGYSMMVKDRPDDFEFYVVPVVIGAVFAFFCAHCFFVVFEIAFDTAFICYCEDYGLNNSTNEPFYATVEFHEKVKKAQEFTKDVEAKKTEE
nr:PREDICTED: choline transporter-like protein 1 [Tribolium castaneum]|eukprot:XP_008198991.1 PREDICTED: choline transporter-like protein 1 [Tribolium castaneum]